VTRERALAIGIGLVVVAAPLAIGGARPGTQVVLSAMVMVLSAVYLFARREHGMRWVALALPAAIALVWTAVQLVPLPPSLLSILSPRAAELRAETGAGWSPLTVDAAATWLALARGFACLSLLVVVTSWVRSNKRARTVLYAIVGAGVLVAIIALVQRAFGADAILGFYHPRSMPGSGLWGTFVDGNHAASLWSLSALVAIGLALEFEGGRRFLFVWCAVACAAMVFYTASRAGAVGLGVGAFALGAVQLVRRFGRATGFLTALALLGCATSATLLLADGLRSRLVPSKNESLTDNQKLRGWRDGLALANEYRWTGVGRGAFEAPVAAFRRDDEAVRLVYPENVLVQSASEWGFPVTLVLAALVIAGLVHAATGLRRVQVGTLGAAAGVLAVLVHELADFGLELPGVAFPTVVALGVVLGRVEEKRHKDGVRPVRVAFGACAAALAAWLVVLAGAAWAAGRTLDVDFTRAQAAYNARSPQLAPTLAGAIARHPADDLLELIAAEDALTHRDPSALRHLNRALRLHPASWQAHYLAARTLLGLGRRGQAALEYRLATERGHAVEPGELVAALGARALDAVPQRSDDLLRFAHWLAAQHRIADADAACRRALELAHPPDAARVERVEVAMETGDAKTIRAAAGELLDGNPDVDGWMLGVRALGRSGDTAATEEALARGLKQHPDASPLMLLGAQLRFERGDLPGARGLLKHANDGSFSLDDRQKAEELLAQIADKAGDVDGAVMARARARMLSRKLSDGRSVYSPTP
jgi:hypothetical protein